MHVLPPINDIYTEATLLSAAVLFKSFMDVEAIDALERKTIATIVPIV